MVNLTEKTHKSIQFSRAFQGIKKTRQRKLCYSVPWCPTQGSKENGHKGFR
jgi:hypothetical protein